MLIFGMLISLYKSIHNGNRRGGGGGGILPTLAKNQLVTVPVS